MKWLIILCLTLSGCSALNPLDVLSPDKPKIEVNAQVAKNAKLEKSNIKLDSNNTNQTADTISNDTKQTADNIKNITQNMPPWVLMLIVVLAALAFDSKEFIKGIKSSIRDIFIVPIKGVANFILLILGREKL